MSLETKEYAKRLVEQMTLEEKISQMRYESPAIERLHIPAYNWWNEALHGVARSGVATMFPQAIALAATFDEELLRRSEMWCPPRDGQSLKRIQEEETEVFIKV